MLMEKELDKQLRDAVVKQLEWAPEIASQDISVNAKDGTVMLSGFVHSYAEKVAAERVAKSVYRVRAVANDIGVRPTSRTDPEIARDIVHALALDVMVPADRVKVTVRDARVTLEGSLDWHFQAKAAESTARRVKSVLDLTNKIAVQTKSSAVGVKTKIEEALRRSAELEARRISVVTSDGTVTLEGNVHTWFEKEQAERAAWAAPGVTSVIDHIQVIP